MLLLMALKKTDWRRFRGLIKQEAQPKGMSQSMTRSPNKRTDISLRDWARNYKELSRHGQMKSTIIDEEQLLRKMITWVKSNQSRIQVKNWGKTSCRMCLSTNGMRSKFVFTRLLWNRGGLIMIRWNRWCFIGQRWYPLTRLHHRWKKGCLKWSIKSLKTWKLRQRKKLLN